MLLRAGLSSVCFRGGGGGRLVEMFILSTQNIRFGEGLLSIVVVLLFS